MKKEKGKIRPVALLIVLMILFYFVGSSYKKDTAHLLIFASNFIISIIFYVFLFLFGLLYFLTSGFFCLQRIFGTKLYDNNRIKDIFNTLVGYIIMEISILSMLIAFESEIDAYTFYLRIIAPFILFMFFLYILSCIVCSKLKVNKFTKLDLYIRIYLVWSLKNIPVFLKRNNFPQFIVAIIDFIIEIGYNSPSSLYQEAHNIEHIKRYNLINMLYEIDHQIKIGLRKRGGKIFGPCAFYMELTLPSDIENCEGSKIFSCRVFVPTFSIKYHRTDEIKSGSKETPPFSLKEHMMKTLQENKICVREISRYDYKEFEDPLFETVFNLEIYVPSVALLKKLKICFIEPTHKVDQGKCMNKWHVILPNSEYIGSFKAPT